MAVNWVTAFFKRECPNKKWNSELVNQITLLWESYANLPVIEAYAYTPE